MFNHLILLNLVNLTMGRPKKNPTAAAVPPKKILSLDGLNDVLSETDVLWDAILRRLTKVSRTYGFFRVETPLVEDGFLYKNFYGHNVSASAALLETAAGGRQAAVRPSMLPSVLRAYSQRKVYEQSPLSKWSYAGLVAKQGSKKDTVDEDFEFGFEVLGTFNHLTEAQVVGAVWDLMGMLGVKDIILEINNIGKPECQAAYQETLTDFLASRKYDLCDSCVDSLSSRPLNVFRCSNLDCQAIVSEAPTILDFLDQESHKHFTNILEALDELGIPYQLNPFLAGPEGHSQTNFIIKYKQKDATVVVGEGGYHEGLMQSICGKNFCCFGFTGSLTAIRKILELTKTTADREIKNDVFLVPLGELAAKKSLRLFRDLTGERISVYDHFGNVGVKNQLKQAEVYKAPIALIMGQKEAVDEMVILRDVKSGMQEVISYDKIVEEVKKRLGR